MTNAEYWTNFFRKGVILRSKSYINADGQFVTMHTIRIARGYGAGLYYVKMIGGKFDSFNQVKLKGV